MRIISARVLAITLSALLVASLAVGCDTSDTNRSVDVPRSEVETGEGLPVKVHVITNTSSACSGHTKVTEDYDADIADADWSITPAGGAMIKGGRFIATKPGIYTIGAKIKDGGVVQTVRITVTGDQIEAAPVEGTPATGDDTALIGTWQWTEITWALEDVAGSGFNVETPHKYSVQIVAGPDGTLVAKWSEGDQPVSFDPATGEVTIPLTNGYSNRDYIGTLSGDTITGRVDWSRNPKGGHEEYIVKPGKMQAVDLNQPWSATRVK